jgi:hypothetical protein
MLTLAIITMLIGMLLGMRFKVLVLLPTMMLAIVAVLGGGIAHHEQAGSIALAILIAIVGVQVGYVGGLSANHALTVMRAARIRKAVPHTRRAVSGHAH